MYQLYGNIATILTVIAYLPYTISILKRKTVPNKTTWLVLFFLGVITLVAYRDVGARATLGVATVNAICPFIIFLLSLRFGEGWRRFSDLRYLALSILALILWGFSKSALIGLTFNLTADFIAFVPTIKKSLLRPWSEDILAWSLFALGGVFNLLAIENWSFSLAVYPLYIVVAEGTVFMLLLIAHIRDSKPNSCIGNS